MKKISIVILLLGASFPFACQTPETKDLNIKKEVQEKKEIVGTKVNKRCGLSRQEIKNTLLADVTLYRARFGMLELLEDPFLSKIAQEHAGKMAGLGSIFHNDSRGGPLQRLKRAGIKRVYVGENLARLKNDLNSGHAVFSYWKTQKKESRNMLNPRYLRVGAGAVMKADYCYWVLLMTN